MLQLGAANWKSANRNLAIRFQISRLMLREAGERCIFLDEQENSHTNILNN